MNDVILQSFFCMLQYRPFVMFIKLSDDFNLHRCVALEASENSVCGPWPKQSVHHCSKQTNRLV